MDKLLPEQGFPVGNTIRSRWWNPYAVRVWTFCEPSLPPQTTTPQLPVFPSSITPTFSSSTTPTSMGRYADIAMEKNCPPCPEPVEIKEAYKITIGQTPSKLLSEGTYPMGNIRGMTKEYDKREVLRGSVDMWNGIEVSPLTEGLLVIFGRDPSIGLIEELIPKITKMARDEKNYKDGNENDPFRIAILNLVRLYVLNSDVYQLEEALIQIVWNKRIDRYDGKTFGQIFYEDVKKSLEEYLIDSVPIEVW